VRLTIDMNLQNIVETELDAACQEFKPKKAIVILMRPQTGEILAIANRPNFDPNDIRTKPASYIQEHEADMKDCAITDEMEPGSTFKMVTAAAALNEHEVQPDSVIFCENGAFSYGGRYLHDHHPYGDLTVEDILVKSSNIGAAKLGMGLGEQRLYSYIRAFGFGERTGVALPGEIPGLVYPPHRWSKLSITRIPMGQEVAVTPLQTIVALSAIANGGRLMMPQIVHDITDGEGHVVSSFPPVEIRRVVSSEAAREVTKALIQVVSPRGTAALAKVSGFVAAGKTGTAEKIDPKGGYMPGKYIVSFCGFLPADDPAFVCLVMLDDAQTKPDQDYGGLVAGPIFSRIGEKVARYMNLEPQAEEPASEMVITQRTQREHD
jgi:cell division protein FtsI (penicillin-binding protein 3)/stage V sporulation protein D (sporulation-specific penicillin-binding protein)